MLTWALLLGLVLACGANPFAVAWMPPGASGADRTARPPLTGCTRFQVQIQDRDGIVVSAIASDPGCGAVRPVLAGPPSFDHVARRVRLPIAIANGSPATLRPPAFVYAFPDSMRVLAAPGLAENSHTSDYLELANADSVASGVAGAPAGAAVWDYGRSLSAADPQTLPPDAHSATRWIEIAVKQGVSDFTVLVTAAGMRAGATVPAEAPDTVPEWFYSDTMFVRNWPEVAGIFRKNIILVAFVPSATQAERQAAIDLIDGEVIGGDRTLGPAAGTYYVLVHEDPTGGTMRRAVETLNALPQVDMAVIDIALQAFYLKPDDGSHYNTWQVLPYPPGADLNWGLEAIDAPLAWGCESGSEATALAVVDNGFHSLTDLQLNTSASPGLDLITDADHGTRVASVLGAIGDNRHGITGTMWHSDLRVVEAALDESGRVTKDSLGSSRVTAYNAYRSIYEAAKRGAAIVNLSLGIQWDSIRSPGYTPHTTADSGIVRTDVMTMRHLLDRIPAGKTPLIVVAAGNEALDAYWAGSPNAAVLHPDDVLVVGASTHDFELWSHSNRNEVNRLVEIAAPGVDVGALDGAGAQVSVSGTSFSAPFVAGVAGLLKSFDPRLTATDLKKLLIEGAQRGNRFADGIPVLNAYESLRLAGRRPGARLCGTPVWWDGTGINASRDGGPERLFEPGEPVFDLNARHGGANLQSFGRNSWSTRELHHGAGGWTAATPTWGPPQDGATYDSTLRYSHGLDTLVTAEVGVAGQATVYITPRGGARNPIGSSEFVAVSEHATSTRIRNDCTTCPTRDGVPNDFRPTTARPSSRSWAPIRANPMGGARRPEQRHRPLGRRA